jgi:hypothetical protein
MRPAAPRGSIERMAHPSATEPSVVIAGTAAAELWSGSVLLGILHDEDGTIVLRLESHARGPVTVSAEALERALAEAREGLTVAHLGSRARTSSAIASTTLR